MLTKRSSQKKKRNNNNSLYESIINDVSKVVKKHLNEVLMNWENDTVNNSEKDLIYTTSRDFNFTELSEDLKGFIKNGTNYTIRMCINDSWSGGIQWYYDELLMEECGFCFFDTWESSEENWSDKNWEALGLNKDSVDPDRKFKTFVDYYDSLSDESQKNIRDFQNKLVYDYFDGNTDISWEDYTDEDLDELEDY
jgi:hypothetical protein